MRNFALQLIPLAADIGVAQTDSLQALRAFEGKWEGTAAGAIETFSLAAPGKEFEVYSETRLKRVKEV